MSITLPTLSVADIVQRRLGAPLTDDANALAAVAMVDSTRAREMRLRSWIPPRLLRRFDRGFARSNTIQPSTARALYAIARALNPEVIAETGTYWGYSTAVLAAALRDEKRGTIHTFDLYKHAGQHIPMELMPWVRMYRGKPATEAMPAVLSAAAPTLFFQDSVHDYDGVLAELRVALPFLAPRAVVLFHDFVVDGVRRAAMDGLPGYELALVDVDDPQQLGIAIAPR